MQDRLNLNPKLTTYEERLALVQPLLDKHSESPYLKKYELHLIATYLISHARGKQRRILDYYEDLDYTIKNFKHAEPLDEKLSGMLDPAFIYEDSQTEVDPEILTLTDYQKRVLHEIFYQIDEDDFKCFVLQKVEGHTAEKIGAHIGLSKTGTQHRIKKVERQIKQILEEVSHELERN